MRSAEWGMRNSQLLNTKELMGLANNTNKFCARKSIDFITKRLYPLLSCELEKAACGQHIFLSIIYVNPDLKGLPAG